MRTNNDIVQQHILFQRICIISIWITVFYSVIIQYKFIQIPYGMLIMGSVVLISFYFTHKDERVSVNTILTRESELLIWFMIYMLIIGIILSPDRTSHLSQWITCLEYLIILIIIASIIRDSGSGTFHILLLAKAVALAYVFISSPVNYAANRYSISTEVNPNGLGMAFATGMWAILYFQQKRKAPLIVTFSLIALFAYCIILTGSRKALIAAVLTIILWLVFCFFPSLKQQRLLHKIMAISILGIIISITIHEFINMYSGSLLEKRMGTIFLEASEGKRSDLYYEGYMLFKENPLFGLGFQAFKYKYGLYSHSTLVEIPVSGGIIGSLIYFSSYVVSVTKLISLYNKTRKNHDMIIEHTKVKMLLVLWAPMLFYTTCIIHQYMIESFILFGIIFGEAAHIESKLPKAAMQLNDKAIGNMYLKRSNSSILINKKGIGSRYIK